MADIALSSVYRADTPILDFTITTPAGAVVDLTSASIWVYGKINKADSDANALFTKTLALGTVVFTSATAGTYYVTLTPSDTAALGRNTIIYVETQIKIGASYYSQCFTLPVNIDVVVAQ